MVKLKLSLPRDCSLLSLPIVSRKQRKATFSSWIAKLRTIVLGDDHAPLAKKVTLHSKRLNCSLFWERHVQLLLSDSLAETKTSHQSHQSVVLIYCWLKLRWFLLQNVFLWPLNLFSVYLNF